MKRSLAMLGLGLAASLASFGAAADTTPPVPEKSGLSLKSAAEIPIQNGGRVKPFDSFARETVLFLTGNRSFKGLEPMDMVLSMISEPALWNRVEFIKVENPDVRRQLMIDENRKYFSPSELLHNSVFQQYAGEMGGEMAAKENEKVRANRKKDLRTVVSRVTVFHSLVGGDALTMVPVAGADPHAPWETLAAIKALDPKATPDPVRAKLADWIRAYAMKDNAKFDAAAQEAAALIRAAAPGWNPSLENHHHWEVIYNAIRPFYIATFIYALAAILWSVNSKSRLWAWLVTSAGLGVHVFGFAVRVYVTGRAPVSNMYETVVYVAFAIFLFAFAIYAKQRHRVVMAVASAIAAFCLFAGDAAPAILDQTMDPIVPVLRSNFWLIIHVLVITAGYATLALSLGISNVGLWEYANQARGRGKNVTARIETLSQMSYRAIQFGVVMLAAGTILGGVWADYSWGRFWGWDPKEVWALIATLTYVALLHSRYTNWVSQFGFNVGAIVCFLTVVMSWYGVNFVLGVGLHSYGVAAGGGGWVGAFAALQLAYVVWVVWLRRQRKRSAA